MKVGMFIIGFLISSFASMAQSKERDVCDCSFSYIVSMSMGGSAKGVTQNVETGILGTKSPLGIMGGIRGYEIPVWSKNKPPQVVGSELTWALYIRPIVKLNHYGISWFRHAITSYMDVRGDYGVSYRAYYLVGESFVAGVEPFIDKQIGSGVNVILTFAL